MLNLQCSYFKNRKAVSYKVNENGKIVLKIFISDLGDRGGPVPCVVNTVTTIEIIAFDVGNSHLIQY